MATPTKEASVVTNPGGTGSSIVPTLPSHQANDEIEIWVTKTGNAAWSAPAGWTIRHQVNSPGSASTSTQGTLLYRRVLSTDSLPLSSPTCNLGATVTRHAIARTIRGADIEGVYTTPSWNATAIGSGTANPIRPASVTTPAPEMLVTHYYCQRLATNAPEPTGYTEDQQVITSGTLVSNVSQKNVADQATILSNQDASPTSGGRWAAVITCAPSIDYPYYRSGSQATATGTSVAPTKPTGTTNSDQRGNKDVMIATVEAAGTPDVSAQDTGLWQEIPIWDGFTSGNGTSVKKYWCHATANPNMTFERSTSGEISVCITTYYNCHQTNPIGNSDADPRASSTTSTWDALNRSNSKALVQATCVADGTPSFTSPTGWIERMDGLGIACSDQTYAIADVTGADSFTLSAASPTLVGLVEVVGVASEGSSGLTLSFSETIANLADAQALGYGLLHTDNAANLADSAGLGYGLSILGDVLSLSDGSLQILGHGTSFADSIDNLADALLLLGHGLLSFVDDAANLSDVLLLGYGHVLADDAANWADEFSFSVSDNELSVQAGDTLNLFADSRTEILSHELALDDVQALSDSYAQELEHQEIFADVLSQQDSPDVVLGYEFALADNSLFAADELLIGYGIGFSDAFTLTDTQVSLLGFELLPTDVLVLTDEYSQQLDHLTAFADLLSFQDALSSTLDHLLTVEDELVLTDDFAHDIALGPLREVGLTDALAQQDAITLELAHLLPAGDALVLSDEVAIAVGILLPLSEDLNLWSEEFQAQADWLLSASDSLVIADGIRLLSHELLPLADSFALSDSFVSLLEGPVREVILSDNLSNWQDAASITTASTGYIGLEFSDVMLLNDHPFILRGPYIPSQKRKTIVPLRARTTVVPKRERETTVG